MIKGRIIWKVIFFFGGGEGGRFGGGKKQKKTARENVPKKIHAKYNPKRGGVPSAWTKEEKKNLKTRLKSLKKKK